MLSILRRTKPITTRKEYLELAKQYHPDNGGTAEEFAHVEMLYHRPPKPNQVQIENVRFSYISQTGDIYIGKSSVLFRTAVPISIPKYSFPDTKVQLEMMKYLPVFVRHSTSYVIVGKANGLHHLPPVLDKIIGTPHASWILSSLYNLLCYLEWAGITHNDIQVDNIWIDPVAHSAHLLGGWWFWAPVDAPLSHLPQSSLPAPKNKLASHIVDLRLIKQLGLQLNGDRTGMTLSRSPKVDFLRKPSSGSALSDYKQWIACLGERKFVELKL